MYFKRGDSDWEVKISESKTYEGQRCALVHASILAHGWQRPKGKTRQTLAWAERASVYEIGNYCAIVTACKYAFLRSLLEPEITGGQGTNLFSITPSCIYLEAILEILEALLSDEARAEIKRIVGDGVK